jgi:hypothetical protein
MPQVLAASAVLFASTMLMPPPSDAHHSSAMYDDKQSITVEGTVARFEWSNPHVYIYLKQMITPDLKRITRGDGVILIDGEFDGAQRTIHMNVSTHDGASASIQGHSIGKWQDNSLVIDTTKFAYYAIGNGYGLPSGAKKHLVERLTPGTDGASLTYHFEMTDPEYLAAPVQGDVQWVFRPNLQYAPLKCDPENARRFTGH